MIFSKFLIIFLPIQAIAIYLSTIKILNQYHQVVIADLIFAGVILFLMYKSTIIKKPQTTKDRNCIL